MVERPTEEGLMAAPPTSLDGVIVADFTRVFSGPFCSQILGDLGADVIKVERVEVGDEARLFGVKKDGPLPGTAFLSHNRNKRSIAIDLKAESGKEIARRLAARADVLVHNFRPGVMERLGLGYDELRQDNPGLIYCEISGFGFDGPLRNRAANDLQIQAYSGLLSITGEPDRPPVRNAASVSDLTSGLYAAVGILSALIERSASGEGQLVRTSMLGGQLNMVNHFLSDFIRQGTVPQRWGTSTELGLPNQVFETEDGAICFTSPNQSAWERTCGALGIPEKALDARFATLADRYANRDALIATVAEAVKKFTSEEALGRLDAVGVPCAPVNYIPDVAVDPQVHATGAIAEVELPSGERVSLVQTPIEFGRTPVRNRIPPPEHGQHTAEILADLGFGEDEIADLRGKGEIA